MEKTRPAIIKGFEDDDVVVVQKLTTKMHKLHKRCAMTDALN